MELGTLFQLWVKWHSGYEVLFVVSAVVCPEETLTGTEPLTGVYPNLVTVLCHPGYITTMEGPDVITDDNYMTDVVIDTYNTTCQEDGTWSFVIACRREYLVTT